MDFEPLHSPEELDSPYNRGGGLALAVSSAAVLLCIILPLATIALKLIGL